ALRRRAQRRRDAGGLLPPRRPQARRHGARRPRQQGPRARGRGRRRRAGELPRRHRRRRVRRVRGAARLAALLPALAAIGGLHGCGSGDAAAIPVPGTDGAPLSPLPSLDPKLDLKALWGTSATDVWAVGANGAIVHYDGKTWTPQKSGVTE